MDAIPYTRSLLTEYMNLLVRLKVMVSEISRVEEAYREKKDELEVCISDSVRVADRSADCCGHRLPFNRSIRSVLRLSENVSMKKASRRGWLRNLGRCSGESRYLSTLCCMLNMISDGCESHTFAKGR